MLRKQPPIYSSLYTTKQRLCFWEQRNKKHNFILALYSRVASRWLEGGSPPHFDSFQKVVYFKYHKKWYAYHFLVLWGTCLILLQDPYQEIGNTVRGVPYTYIYTLPLLFKDTRGGADANGATHTQKDDADRGRAKPHNAQSTAQTPSKAQHRPERTEARPRAQRAHPPGSRTRNRAVSPMCITL